MDADEMKTFVDICKKLYMEKADWPDSYPHEGEVGEVWEQVCAEVLLLHGPPPPHPGFGPQPKYDIQGNLFDAKSRRDAYVRRVDYLTGLENTVMKRYKLHPGLMGPFVAAFEMWCIIRREESCESDSK